MESETYTPEYEVSGRGLKYYKPTWLSGEEDASISVYESSLASDPCLWVMLSHNGAEEPVQLTLGEAAELANTLAYAVENHYQND